MFWLVCTAFLSYWRASFPFFLHFISLSFLRGFYLYSKILKRRFNATRRLEFQEHTPAFDPKHINYQKEKDEQGKWKEEADYEMISVDKTISISGSCKAHGVVQQKAARCYVCTIASL